MRLLFLLVLSVGAGVLCAQNTPPTIQVTALGGSNVANGSTIPVSATFTLNSAGIIIHVDDAQMDQVSINASVSNLSTAGNWSEANFNKLPTTAPYQHQVQAVNGLFGPVGTVYTVTLTLSDGAATTNFGFAIKVEHSGTSNTGDSSGSGGCAAGTPAGPGGVALAGALLIWRRRRRGSA
jgi:MYXO-CTERM domain-containing protein